MRWCFVVGALAACGSSSAAPDAAPVTLTITRISSFTVTSTPAGIACGTTCSATFAPGSTVSLTYTEMAGICVPNTETWSGCTKQPDGSCTIKMTGDLTVDLSCAIAQP